jgi:hypothetical protein
VLSSTFLIFWAGTGHQTFPADRPGYFKIIFYINGNQNVHERGLAVNTKGTTSTIAGYVTVVSVITFLILLAVLHFLEPAFNPPHLISEYELGTFGFLMSFAFFCMGAGTIFLTRAIWSDLRTKSGHFGRWLLLLIGIAYLGAGIFPPDPAWILGSRLHVIFGLTVIFSSPIIFTLLARSIVSNAQWSGVSRIVTGITILTWIGLLSFFASILIFYGITPGSTTIVVGWTNRFMIVTYSAWLITLAWQTVRIGRVQRVIPPG